MAHKFKCACGTTTRMVGREAEGVMKKPHYSLIKGYTGPYNMNSNAGRLKKKKMRKG